ARRRSGERLLDRAGARRESSFGSLRAPAVPRHAAAFVLRYSLPVPKSPAGLREVPRRRPHPQ
ncbi:hypothetical protein, partial [Burkholderia glumae]|uniref:hypothetical protein n=1 Tax=Burkholderia glumae TaxID=337 RepID=UPI0019D6DB6B